MDVCPGGDSFTSPDADPVRLQSRWNDGARRPNPLARGLLPPSRYQALDCNVSVRVGAPSDQRWPLHRSM